MRAVATFKSDLFKLTEPKDYFINPGCFGDDVARWLMERFKASAIDVEDEPGQEDFGWYVRYVVDGRPYGVVIGHEAEAGWCLVVERPCGLLGSILGQRHRTISPRAVEVVRSALVNEPGIRHIQWFYWQQCRRGRLTDGAGAPHEP